MPFVRSCEQPTKATSMKHSTDRRFLEAAAANPCLTGTKRVLPLKPACPQRLSGRDERVFEFKDFKSENYLSSVISSDMLIQQISGKDSISQLKGMCVKAVAYFDDNFKTTFSYELKELYAESFDALSYTIPEGYKKK